MGIHVLALERVLAKGQRSEKDFLRKTVAGAGPSVIAGDGSKIVENVIHSTVFGVQDVLHVAFGLGRSPSIDPTGHFHDDIEGLFVRSQRLHVEEASHDLVQRVKRCPNLLTPVEAFEKLNGKSAQVAVLVKGGLTCRESRNELVGLRLDLVVTRRRKEQSRC